jgi:hypothetical protein
MPTAAGYAMLVGWHRESIVRATDGGGRAAGTSSACVFDGVRETMTVQKTPGLPLLRHKETRPEIIANAALMQ